MISEDKIAAAQLAQIFGSELTQIDEAVTYRSGNTSSAVKINPKQILLGQETKSATNNQVLTQLQREAEAAFPLDPVSQTYQAPPVPQQHVSNSFQPKESTPTASHAQFDRLCGILERLVVVLEDSDVIIKKQPQTRKHVDEASH